MKFEAPRGTQDLLPGEQPVREAIVDAAKHFARTYGYQRVLTPTFEDANLFVRTSGVGSEVVQKEMYTLGDRSGRELALRPEGTAPIARAYVEHGLHKRPQPVKLYYISPMFRYARGQRGRYREFWQIGLEALGSSDPLLDAELMVCFREIVDRLETHRLHLVVNSIGDRKCRPRYLDELSAFLRSKQSKLDPDSRNRLRTSPLRVFDSKDERTQEILTEAPKITDHLCEDCARDFRQVRSYLRAFGLSYRIVPTLVRGLDYYTRTVWEFRNPKLGTQDSVCAGGRYDYLVEEVGGQPTPAVGWAAGIERIALSVAHPQRFQRPEVDIFVVFEDVSRRREMLPRIRELRKRWACELDYATRSPRRQFEHAARRGARMILIIPAGSGYIVRSREDRRQFKSWPVLESFLVRELK